jgi:hypothetical protein
LSSEYLARMFLRSAGSLLILSIISLLCWRFSVW